MADNISVTQGSGTTVAADDVGGVLYQRVKVAYGVDGSATDVSTSNAFPVNFTNASLAVTGTFWQATQPVSVASLPLPSGAATAAKQPDFGVAGSASTNVLTVQGIAAMTALKVDGSAVTQPVSGSVTANAGSGTFAISAASLPLPSGASTAANQTTLNTAIGSTTDAVVANGASGSALSYLRTLKDAATDTTTPSPVKIDQTTVGTTNAVSLAQMGATTVATGNGTASAGCQRVTIASDNTAFSVNATSTPATTAHALIPAPSTYRLLSAAATTNGANIKASAGTVKGIQGYNAKASAVYLKLYNKASSPTVGTDTPVKTIYLPATAAFALDFGTGLTFATGISIALTGAGADADTTALASGDILALNVDYH
jgi:hypothetical protein